MSVLVSSATPRVSRQPVRTWRLTDTLSASRGKNSTILISTSSTSGRLSPPGSGFSHQVPAKGGANSGSGAVIVGAYRGARSWR